MPTIFSDWENCITLFTGDAWKYLLDTAGLLIQDYDQEAVVSLTKFIDQLPSVINQVLHGHLYNVQSFQIHKILHSPIKYAELAKPGHLIYCSCLLCIQVTQGTSEFKPTPPENREFFKKSYSVPHTLLVILQACII